MNSQKFDLANVLFFAGLAITALSQVIESQQRKQDNLEIAREVVKLMKEGE